jgi:hypothetical protein
MTPWERKKLASAIRHFMKDETEDTNWWQKGMDALQAIRLADARKLKHAPQRATGAPK